MDINVVHQYSHIGEKLLRLTYVALGVNLTGMLQVCDGCARSKAKACAVRNKTYTRASKLGERIFVDTNGPLTEILIGKQYWIYVVDDYIIITVVSLQRSSCNCQRKRKNYFKT